jgi:aryl-alcohol dehydrogenase-like predicted oxidoreductase
MGTAVSRDQAFRLLDHFVDHGGTFIDTARAYAIWEPRGEGASETTIGEWLASRPHRDRVIVATKGGHPAWTDLHSPRLSRQDVTDDCEQSLSALGLDTIPLYWLHRDDPTRPVEDIIATLEWLRERGKIRYYGFSNWSTARMKVALRYQQSQGLTGFVANQPMWSYAEVNPEGVSDDTSYRMDEPMRQFHRATKLPAIPYTAQAKGFFTKWAEQGWENLTPSLRMAYDNETNHHRFNKITAFAQESGQSISALSLAWLISQTDFLTIPIVWTSQSERLAEILAAADLELTPDRVRALE